MTLGAANTLACERIDVIGILFQKNDARKKDRTARARTLNAYSETDDAGQDVNFPKLGIASVTLNLNRRGIRDNFGFQQTVAPVGGLRIAWGSEVRRDFASASSFFYTLGDDQTRLFRIFLNA